MVSAPRVTRVVINNYSGLNLAILRRGMMNFANWGLGGPSTSVAGVMDEVMRNGNVPVAGRMGTMGSGGVIPPAMLEESRVPNFYLEAISACGAIHSSTLPNTALVYNLMVTSGLPRPVLSYIWSAVNRSLPGQLTRSEFFSCLALIALAQKGESLAALSTMSQLPIPFLQTFAAVTSQSTGPGTRAVPTTPFAKMPITLRPPDRLVLNPVRPPTQHASVTGTRVAGVTQSQLPAPPVTSTGSPSKSRFSAAAAFIPTGLLYGKKDKGPLPQPPPPQPQANLEQQKAGSSFSSTGGSNTNGGCQSSDLLAEVFSSSAPSTATGSSQNVTSSCGSATQLSDSSSSETTSRRLSSTTISSESACVPPYQTSDPSISTTSRETKKSIDPQQLESWVRAICGACELLEDANRLWKPEIESSVLREVAETEKGANYLESLLKAVRTLIRLHSVAKGLLPPDVEKRSERARAVWKRLEAVGVSTVYGAHPVLEEASDSGCGICTWGVAEDGRIEYGGRTYHSECANLWVNRVNPLLPNLHLR